MFAKFKRNLGRIWATLFALAASTTPTSHPTNNLVDGICADV